MYIRTNLPLALSRIYTELPRRVLLAMPVTRSGKLGKDPRSKALHASCSARKTGRGKPAEESRLHDQIYRDEENSARKPHVNAALERNPPPVPSMCLDVTISDTVNTKPETN